MLKNRVVVWALAAIVVLPALFVACSGPERDETFSETPTPVSVSPTPTTESADVNPATATEVQEDAPADPTATSEVEQDATATIEGDEPTPTGTPTQADATATQPGPTSTATQAPTPPATIFDPSAVSLAIEEVGSGFVEPTFVTDAGDGTGTLYVTEKGGTIRFLTGELFIDLTDRVINTGMSGNKREQGLLGLAFHPDFENNGYFYVHYNDFAGDTVISRFQVGPDGLGDPTSEKIILTIEQHEDHFNGGMIMFGPDGYFYIAMGTGGGAPEDFAHSQDLGSLLGKILRIDVNSGDPYGIPPDNPFVSTEGARPEIWAYGLRNPWRISFDLATNDLYIADAGQFSFEWVHFQPAGSPGGQNYGWPIFEGRHCFEAETCDPPPNYQEPILEYPRTETNCVIIGGYVYRGAAYPDLQGAYLFSDFCSARIWAGWRDESGAWQVQELTELDILVSSFGEDEAGELYIVDILNGSIFRLVSR